MTASSEDDEIVRLLTLDEATPPLGAALEAQLVDLTPVVPRRPRRQLALLLGVTGIVVIGLLVLLHTRADLHQLPAGWVPSVAALWTAGILATGWCALVPRRGSMMPRWRLALAAVAVTSFAFVLLGLFIHPAGPSSMDYGWERFGRGRGCLELGLATALVPMLAGAWFIRGIAPVRARWIAAAVGAVGGCAGGLLLHFYCRIADGPHIGVFHGGVVVCAAVIGGLVLPRLTATRSSTGKE